MTPQQLAALDRIRDIMSAGGIEPSVREIARILDMQVSSAARLIDSLVEQGHLTKIPNRARSLRLAGVPDLRGIPTAALAGELARRGKTLASLDPRERVATGGERTCAADSCGHAVQRGHLMCRTHWFALPAALRERILRTNAARDRHGFERAVTEARDLIDSGQYRRVS